MATPGFSADNGDGTLNDLPVWNEPVKFDISAREIPPSLQGSGHGVFGNEIDRISFRIEGADPQFVKAASQAIESGIIRTRDQFIDYMKACAKLNEESEQ